MEILEFFLKSRYIIEAGSFLPFTVTSVFQCCFFTLGILVLMYLYKKKKNY